MLKKELCLKAIAEWNNAREHYSEIKELITPTSVFTFDKKQCNWVRENNKNSFFHTYIGVYGKKLISIIVPIDRSGSEIDLPEYLTSTIAPLSKDLKLIEREVVTTVKKITLSKDLDITDHQHNVKLPFTNAPTIDQHKSVEEIISWKNNCLDWFYNECIEFNGQRIFKAFVVPMVDLVKNKNNVDEVVCLFGLKQNEIHNRLIPVLIYVSHTSKIKEENLTRTSKKEAFNEVESLRASEKEAFNEVELLRTSEKDPETGNIDNFSSPRPPFGGDIDEFNLFK